MKVVPINPTYKTKPEPRKDHTEMVKFMKETKVYIRCQEYNRGVRLDTHA